MEKDGKLHAFRFSDAKVSRPLYLLHNKNRKLSLSAKLFMEMLTKQRRSDEKKTA